MYLLFETAVGYALFKIDDSKFSQVESWKDLPSNSAGAAKLFKLVAFKQFEDAKDVLQASVKMINGKLSKTLAKFLKKNILSKDLQHKLLVGDKKIAGEIGKELGIACESTDKTLEFTRCLRTHMADLLADFNIAEAPHMSLSLAHGLGRFNVKFSADKVDTMIIQAISLHEDLDKEINNYMMRLKEWYGYHFPELIAQVADPITYVKVVKAIGKRNNTNSISLEELVGEEADHKIKQASDVSMGTEISDQDEEFILKLTDQILELDTYRSNLEEYLRNRMLSVAPNLSNLVGEIIAAKLVAKAGSLINLAKFSASTLQIIGAEKALFKAMRSKKQTPKYGIIYQTKMVGSANGRAKGKIARALAAKSSLCVRVDALAEEEDTEISTQAKTYLENRLRYLEENQDNEAKKPGQQRPFQKQPGTYAAQGGYNQGADFSLGKRPNGPGARFGGDKRSH
jgi:nucleolar protein 58